MAILTTKLRHIKRRMNKPTLQNKKEGRTLPKYKEPAYKFALYCLAKSIKGLPQNLMNQLMQLSSNGQSYEDKLRQLQNDVIWLTNDKDSNDIESETYVIID